jgi:hypothetical protein
MTFEFGSGTMESMRSLQSWKLCRLNWSKTLKSPRGSDFADGAPPFLAGDPNCGKEKDAEMIQGQANSRA